MKPLVIYHADCTDGYGAAFAAWMKLGDEAEYVPMNYNSINPADLADLTDDREVYILDFSLPRVQMDSVFRLAKRVVWLDHHASVMKEWGEGSVPAGVEVRLSNEHIAYVDPDDYDKIKNFSWSEHVKGGAVAWNPSQGINVYMHHLILPKKEGFVIDHINRNSLDNRQCNLRYATRSQNGANGVWNEARYKGVTQHGKGFKAQITVNYENKVIGTFPTEEEAARAYDEEARKQWGLFARTNFDQREPFPPNAHVVLNNNKSGALLAWEYFHPGTEVPILIQHIDDRDRWQWKMEGSAKIHAALGSMAPWSFDQWEELIADEHYGSLFSEGCAILRAQKQHVERMAKQARKCVIPYSEVPTPKPVAIGLAVNTPLHQSEVGHELANASGTYGLVWYLGSDGRVRCSLRSNGDYDVSSIARSFGGGGHRNAAGFETDLETLMSWLT